MPLNCSSSRESKYLTFPAILWEMIPLVAKSESLSEVFPWSTWAKMQMFRTLAVLCWSSLTVSGASFMINWVCGGVSYKWDLYMNLTIAFIFRDGPLQL